MPLKRSNGLIDLEKTKAELKKLMDYSIDIICTIDKKGRFVNVSAAALTILGYTPQELIGQLYMDHVYVKDRNATYSAAVDIMRGISKTNFANRYIHKNGHLVPITWSASWDNEDKIMHCIARDETEKEASLTQLKESQQKLKTASRIARLGYWQLRLDGTNRYWSDEVYEIWGVSKENFVVDFDSFMNTIHPDDREKFRKEQIAFYLGEKKFELEYRIILPDNSVKWVYELGDFLKDEHGNNDMFQGTVQDISKRKEEELRLKLLESVITNAKDSVMIAEAGISGEAGSIIVYVNEAFTRMTGYTSAEVIGKTSRLLQGPQTDKEELKKLGEAIRQGQPYEVNTINYKKNGQEFWINFSVSPVTNKENKITHFISIQRDITVRKNEESQLKLFANDLYKRNKELQQFGYVVSHNLRSPVANIMGITTLLELYKDDPQTVETCSRNLKTSVSRLDSVIRDLSKILSATDGSVDLNKENVNLAYILADVKADLKESIRSSGAKVSLPEVEHVLFTHKAYLYSIFYNLIGNAIKYRSQKAPNIKISIRKKTDLVRITVSDNGIGIDMERHKEDLFKPYKRFNSSVDGKGLGLFLVKSHIEALGGRILVDSKVGKGTTFTIEFPLNNESLTTIIEKQQLRVA